MQEENKMMNKKLKVLALHGFMQNAGSYRSRTSALRRSLNRVCAKEDYYYIQAPFQMNHRDTGEPMNAFSWWHTNDDFTVYDGVEDSVRHVVKEMKEHGPFDVLLGFSQGASMVSILSRLATPELPKPDWAHDIEIPPFKCAVMIGGFIPRDVALNEFFQDASISVPSLHVIGEADERVSADRQHALSQLFVNKTVVSHPGGHFIPTNSEFSSQYLTYLKQFIS